MFSSAPQFVRLTQAGVSRVLNGQAGMLFEVDHCTRSGDDKEWVAHVSDYRYMNSDTDKPQIWSISADGYEPVTAAFDDSRVLSAIRLANPAGWVVQLRGKHGESYHPVYVFGDTVGMLDAIAQAAKIKIG